MTHLPETRKSPSLNLTQCTATTDKCNSTSRSNGGEQLEDVPRGIVQEEDSFDRNQGSEEDSVGNRSGLECGREMVEVNAEEEPLEQISINPTGENRFSSTHHARQNRKSSQGHSQETKCNSNRWVLGVPLENVMDFGQLAVSRHLDRWDWFVGVAGNRQLERGLIVGFRGAK